ncbi:hypothetical protein Bca4012_063866 [Brassica carinata]
MFGFLFHRWGKASKCKKLLQQLQSRLKLLKNKNYAISRHLRDDIALFIRINDHTRALLRTKQLLRVQNSISIYDLLLKFSEFILLHFSSIRKHRELVNDDISEAVSSLVFASARCGELPELVSIRELFVQRYGQNYVTKALQLLPGHLVNFQIKEKLSVTSVPEDLKSKLLDEIAKETGLRLEMLRLEYKPEDDKQVKEEEEKKVMDTDLNSFSDDQSPEVYKFSLTDMEEEKSKEERSMEDDYIKEAQDEEDDHRVFRFRESSEEERSSLSSSSLSLRRFKDMESLRYYKRREKIRPRRRSSSSSSNCYHIVYNVFWVKNEEEEEEVRKRLLPKHVHPKLPDYDQIAAQFKALRTQQPYDILELVQAQDQTGFISLDCGLEPKETNYVEKSTNITYRSDFNYIETGVAGKINEAYTTQFQQQTWSLRSFPVGQRNCYTFNLTANRKYLIRGTFIYGNYDGLNQLPIFDLYIGPNKWTTVTTLGVTNGSLHEMIHVLTQNRLQVCLVKTGDTTPFISSLELRPLNNETYVTQSGSLVAVSRVFFSPTPSFVRYDEDIHDRTWVPYVDKNNPVIRTDVAVDTSNFYNVPQVVARTAAIPANESQPLTIDWALEDATSQSYIYMHFAEIQNLKANETREFNITYNGGQRWFSNFRPPNFSITTIFNPRAVSSPDGKFNFTFAMTSNSTLPPLINALEIYKVLDLTLLETNQDEVLAMMNIKATYELRKIPSWQGDPCVPQSYRWEGLDCSYPDSEPQRIISLNLTGSNLTGSITSDISKLTQLTELDLSNNDLSGEVPAFFADMKMLTLINLSGNPKVNGSVIPDSLQKRIDSKSLTLILDGNQNPTIRSKSKDVTVVAIAASVAGGFALIVIVAIIFVLTRRKQKPPEGPESVTTGTANTETRSSNPSIITKERRFTYSEVELLLRVHHRHLVGLVGYCDDGDKLALIYEYMANGDLRENMLGKRSGNVLSWETRMQIAVEAAQGLEYLHNGCRPPMVHRDVKTTNILLNERFQAKLADFGLSRSFPIDGESHVMTVVAGTPGYLDPEYYRTNWLSEKSDVYSFGVVLLEMVTNQPVIDKTRVKPHISDWVGFKLTNGDIRSIIDPKLMDDYDSNGVWKVIELALACVNPSSNRRPTMPHVVMELNECLAFEVERKHSSQEMYTKNSTEFSPSSASDFSPIAR